MTDATDFPARIVNLTQHPATPDQIAANVFDLPPDVAAAVRHDLTFDVPPGPAELRACADNIAAWAAGTEAKGAMIGGAAYLMPYLELALIRRGIRPLHAFTRRETVEQAQPDGSVRKVAVFRHAGWVDGGMW